jgi:hypothetical protein
METECVLRTASVRAKAKCRVSYWRWGFRVNLDLQPAAAFVQQPGLQTGGKTRHLLVLRIVGPIPGMEWRSFLEYDHPWMVRVVVRLLRVAPIADASQQGDRQQREGDIEAKCAAAEVPPSAREPRQRPRDHGGNR